MYDSILLLSGGIDSSTVAYQLKNQNKKNIRCVYFNLNMSHSGNEIQSVKKISFDLELPLEIVNLNGIAEMVKGYIPLSILDGDTKPPEPPSASPGIASGFHVLMSVAIFYAQILKINNLDIAITKDQLESRKTIESFVSEFPKVTNMLNEELSQIKIRTPFKDKYKHEIINLAQELNLDLSQTWSCYYGYNEHCGDCFGCRQRISAFQNSKVKDPTVYRSKSE